MDALAVLFVMFMENVSFRTVMFAPASGSSASSVIVRVSFMVARVLFALSLVMFKIPTYGTLVSVTDTVLVAVSGTFPAGSGCAMYSIRYVPTLVQSTRVSLVHIYRIHGTARSSLETYLKLQQEQYL